MEKPKTNFRSAFCPWGDSVYLPLLVDEKKLCSGVVLSWPRACEQSSAELCSGTRASVDGATEEEESPQSVVLLSAHWAKPWDILIGPNPTLTHLLLK